MFEQIKSYYRQLIPHLADTEWKALEDCLEIMNYKKGELVIAEGKVCNHVYFINSGWLRLFMTVDGKQISTGFIGSREYVSAYNSFLTRQPSLENIEVLENAELLLLSYSNMQQLYKQYPVFETFGRKIAEQLFIWGSQRNNALLLLTPEQRYQQMIANNPALSQQIPQYMLASYIGVTPEHLSRLRKKMSRRIS